ncbi:type II toxin-antitoxin system PemK/MazF family toxin [Halochromatium glycolicum]|uniref:PemK family protein n=1 Tax=Halochromatium glycolicum TaxID=85075 RepID=A0AAJ0XAU0_9GAMM|nr:PemK family protein [Halochromatium glycolicum]
MKRAGQIALMPFPFTDLTHSKKRPVLLLRRLDHTHDDWLVCMVSSRLNHAQPGLDWVLTPDDDGFAATGLKVASVFRLSRLAVLDGSLLLGQLGCVSETRLCEPRHGLSHWIECRDE